MAVTVCTALRRCLLRHIYVLLVLLAHVHREQAFQSLYYSHGTAAWGKRSQSQRHSDDSQHNARTYQPASRNHLILHGDRHDRYREKYDTGSKVGRRRSDVDLKRKTRKFESVLNGTPQLFKERAHTVKSILTDIRSGNTKKLHLNRLNHGILCAGRIKQLDDAREIFEWISQSEHFNLSVQSFNNMIWAAGNVGQLDLAKQYFNDLVARGRDNAGQSKKSGRKLTPNAHTFGSILHACSRSKSYKQALMYLDEMINMGLTPNQVVCTSAIDTCTKVGRYIEAVEIMERMTREYGLEPDTTMMNAVVKGFCLQGEYKRAEDILMAAAKPDIFTYHTLMMAYAKAGNFKSCLWVFDRLMENPNVRPDSGIYSLAMLAYANAQNYASVVMIDELARGEGVKLPPVAYTFLIKSLGKLGRFDSVIHVLDEMMDHGIEPNVITYSTAVSALRPSPELVHDVLTRFDKSQLKPNVIFLTSAIYALSGGGKDSTPLHVEKAYTIWQHMEEHGPAPNIQTYNNIAKSFAEAGEVEKAMSVLEVMHGRGVRPDKFTFTLLLHACAVRSSTDRIPEIMRSMLLAGIPHDEISFGAAMNAYRRAGDALGAVACLNEMAKLNVTATVSHYNIVLRALKEGKYIDKMYRMVLALSRSGCQSGSFQVNFNTFQIALEKLISLERCHECMVLIKEMDRHNLQPDLQLCVDIVQVLERSRQYRAVFAMYQLMVRHNYQFYENAALNGVFKRLVSVAAKSVDADLRSTAEVVRDEFVLWGFEFTQKVKELGSSISRADLERSAQGAAGASASGNGIEGDDVRDLAAKSALEHSLEDADACFAYSLPSLLNRDEDSRLGGLAELEAVQAKRNATYTDSRRPAVAT